MRAPSVHLPDKIVSHVLKAAYPTSQPGSFSSEIAELLQQLDAVSIAPAPPSSRFADRNGRERDKGAG